MLLRMKHGLNKCIFVPCVFSVADTDIGTAETEQLDGKRVQNRHNAEPLELVSEHVGGMRAWNF
jgi:hypothetical protein